MMNENKIATVVIGAAIEVHKNLGPGLLESIYETALAYELQKINFDIRRQVLIPVRYKEIVFTKGFLADIIVNNKVILELKSVRIVEDVHKKQLLSYLRLSNLTLGLLINFNSPYLKEGIFRVINGIITD